MKHRKKHKHFIVARFGDMGCRQAICLTFVGARATASQNNTRGSEIILDSRAKVKSSSEGSVAGSNLFYDSFQ